MARGRKTEPAEIKQAKGNPGRRKIVTTPDAAPQMGNRPPEELWAAGKRIWNQLAPDLMALKFLRSTDRPAFTRYCEHLAKWWELTRDLRKEGETYMSKSEHNPDGMMRVNPKFLIRERIEKRLEALEDRFGLSPAARQQILQRLALTPVAAPAGALFEGAASTPGTVPPPATDTASPIGMLGRAAATHH